MTDVLLVNAPVPDTRASGHASLNPPLGLASIGAVLREHGYGVEAADLNVSGLNPTRVRQMVDRATPRVLGISAHTETYPNALRVAAIAKDAMPDLPVVLGGPHPTVTHERTVQEPAVDYVVRGEGEYAMLELLDRLVAGEEPDDVAGLTYRRDGGVVVTPDREFVQDPDELPFPARDLFPLHLYQSPGNVLFSRGGCPFNCHFCAVNSIWGDGARRFRDPDEVAAEVRELVEEYGISHVNFADDVFTLDRRRVSELLDRFESLSLDRPWSWTCATRVDLVDRDLLQRLADAGCTGIQLGVEAGSQQVLDAIGKRITLEQVREAVGNAVDAGLDVLASFMFPHPADTRETIHAQIELMRELHDLGADLSLAFTTPYPGTQYDHRADDLGIEVHADGWDEYDAKHLVISTRNLSFEELETLRDELVRSVGLERRNRDRVASTS